MVLEARIPKSRSGRVGGLVSGEDFLSGSQMVHSVHVLTWSSLGACPGERVQGGEREQKETLYKEANSISSWLGLMTFKVPSPNTAMLGVQHMNLKEVQNSVHNATASLKFLLPMYLQCNLQQQMSMCP